MDFQQSNDGLRELHLFAGAGGGIIAGQLLGHRTVCAVELEPYAQAILVARQNDGCFPPFPIWDDVRNFNGKPWRGVVDVVAGGFPCFTSETHILSKRGFVPIDTVAVGDEVLTHLGRWKPVTSVMRRGGASLRKISGTGILPTHTTDEHPYYARSKSQLWNNEKRSYDRKFSAPDWVKSKDLKTTHFAGQVLPDVAASIRANEWFWLVGRYLADGWRVDRHGREFGRVVICGHKKEAGELASRIAAAGFNASQIVERSVVKFHITKTDFYRDLAEFGRLAHGKTLPGWIFSISKEQAINLINGWTSGDGARIEPQRLTKCTTVSKPLALGMALLAQRAFGVVANIYQNNVPPTTKIEDRIVNQRTQYQVVICDRNRSSIVDGDYGWKRITKNKTAGVGEVFNISVADDESYVANGAIVHNCQDISAAGKGAGLSGERSGLWSEMARIIGEVRPRYAFIENSPMLVTRGLERVLCDLADLGYDAKWCCLSAADCGAWHERNRIWILATNTRDKRIGWGKQPTQSDKKTDVTNDCEAGYATRSIETHQSKIRQMGVKSWGGFSGVDGIEKVVEKFCRVDDGMAYRSHSIAAIGNGQVPLCAAIAWKILGGE